LLCAETWWPGVRALWRRPCGRALLVISLAQLISILVSTALSNDLELAIGGTSSRRLGALTLIAIVVVTTALAALAGQNREFTRRLLTGIEISGGVAAIYAILQYLGLDPLLPARLYTFNFVTDFVRPPSTFGHATYFANFLLPVILIASGSATRKFRRWFHCSILMVAGIALVLTGTRSAVLGLIAGGTVLAWSEAKHIGKRKVGAYLGLSVLVGVVIMVGIVLSPVGGGVQARLSQWGQDSRGGPRLMVWRDSLILFRKHWLTGIGPEAFTGEFRKIQSLELSRAYPEHYHEDPHNLLLGAGINQGVAGLAILLSLVLLGAVSGFKSIRRSSPEGGMLLGILLAMTVSFQFSPLTISNWMYFCATIGILVAIASESGRTTPAERTPFGAGAKILLVCGASATILVACLYVAQDALVAATGKRLAQSDLDGARECYRLAARIPLPANNLWCSQQMALFARSSQPELRQAALSLAKEASANAERTGELKFAGLYQSALLSPLSNDVGQAEIKLRAAIAAAPGWDRPVQVLATLPRKL
jgi:O-antigen ligase